MKINKTVTKTCIIYCRTATSNQNYRASSILSQQKICFKFANNSGYQILAVAVDNGYSGMNLQRPGIKTMVTKVKRLKPDYLVMSDETRLSKNVTDYFYLKKVLSLSGTQIKYCNQPNLSDDSLKESMTVAFAEVFSKNISLRIKRGLQMRKEMPKNGTEK